jgi:hypothetical protein
VGDLIEFPNKRSCFKCEHYASEVSRCFLFDEQIDSEIFAAKDCNGYEVASA